MKTSKISKEIPRKVEPQIKINRKKTPKEITNRIQEIEYVDPATGESDSLDITFSNADKSFILGKTSPKKGDKISARPVSYTHLTLPTT